MKGILNINKEKGWTSFDVVAKLRKILGIKKIGHLGTLDPMATGVLPITIGSATKLFDDFLKKEKTYVAEFQFGYETNSLDITGEIINKCEKIPTIDEIKKALDSFIGNIMQLPPQCRDKKVDVMKACDVARKGEEITLKPVEIHINKIDILSYDNDILRVEIECGAGTYIRALGRDIAYKLETYATMISLQRTQVGVFSLYDAISLNDCTIDNISSKIIPIDFVFNYPKIHDEKVCSRLLCGQKISDLNTLKNILPINSDIIEGMKFNLYLNNEFVAIAEIKNCELKLYKYFG